jgi:formylglycine-generating enzyme
MDDAGPRSRIEQRELLPVLRTLIAGLILSGCGSAFAGDAWHFDYSNGRPVKLSWVAANAQNYDLFASEDLKSWTHVEGFPKTGTGALMEHPFAAGTRGFFQIRPTTAPEAEFVYIPAGEYEMGDTTGEGLYDERPVHRVSLNAFHAGRFEVTKALWDEVREWGRSHGYSDLPAGCLDSNGTDYSKGPGHPVFAITWSDAVKWCNARSERDGLTPCYYQDASRTVIHRTGQINLSAAMVNWKAAGYRLPTEAEWEKAARGGVSGTVYPWGATISHADANYTGHPIHGGGTAPVGSFAPNGYGLYNVSGNVAEFCWDEYMDVTYEQTHQFPPVLDPAGPVATATGERIFRGGGWASTDWSCRTAARSGDHIGYLDLSLGLRLVRGTMDERFVKIDNGQPSIPLPWPNPAVPTFSFTMGRTTGDTSADAPPVMVNVRYYHLAQYEVTKGLWDRVRDWALTHGYTDLAAGGGKGANHPVHSVSWYNTVKWCNARSERDGLAPCYKVAGAIYRTGISDAVTCDWNASGYRLPSEAEWEAAARGGETGRRFPWGDSITHSQANYSSNDFFSYDTSPTRGFHPLYRVGGAPYTAPVGSFAPNGFGLHDMIGNAWERCWDWYQADYYSAGVIDPRGPASGTLRLSRGGGWSYYADLCRSAHRDKNTPSDAPNGHGFRLARSIGTPP